MAAPPTTDVEMLAILDRLDAESNARRAELREIAGQLPATMSRRALISTLVADLRDAPNKGAIARRAVGKLVRAPLHLAKRIQLRLQSR